MSAEVLREAARLMRERARAATRELPDQRWKATPTIDPDNHGWVVASDIPEADWDTTVAQLPYDYEGDTAPHIASWHPDVALAVADLLDIVEAGWEDFDPDGAGETKMHFVCAWSLNLARAYLGGDS